MSLRLIQMRFEIANKLLTKHTISYIYKNLRNILPSNANSPRSDYKNY